MTIVMGLDQHRAQITAEWLDTDTGEISRSRVAPADRAGVRRFLRRFRGVALEVALEATTGWRFVVEELRAIGANVHLAEPAETAALRGNKKRAKNDRADARHHRELLLAGRLPESWIPPDHILDLRAQVRLRHALTEQRAEWQQRIQSVLYHHGCPKRGDLINAAGLEWLAAQPLRACTREQVTIALSMVDALDVQRAPLDRQLRAYARRHPGCKALIAAHYGIGPLVAVTVLAELGDCRRFSSSREAATPGSTSPCTRPTDGAHPGGYPDKDRRRCAGRCSRPPNARGDAARQTTPTTREAAERLGGNRACLAVSRKLLKRSYHTLRELGEEALQPA
jgi:transposase